VGTSAPLLPPVRKATPVDQQETKVNTTPGHAPHPSHGGHANRGASPWAAKEDTVRSGPPGAGPQPTETTTAPSTSPDRRASEGGSALAFKLATVVLVLLALALAGAYLFQMFNQPKEVFVPPGGQGAEHADEFKGPAWELEVAALNRRPGDALRLASDGDAAWHIGSPEVAMAKYLEAWKADQQPETALKLGELYFQQDKLAEAKGFWARFQKDRPDSKANSYIDRMLPK
jgi:serine/threonine-protein kinase